MAVVNLKSTIISNRDATPKVLTDSYVSGGPLHESEGYVQSASATDSSGSIYRLCQVPSNARVSSIVLQSDALGGSCAAGVGVYYPTFIPVGAGLSASNASAVISATFFASAQSLATAVSPTEVINQSGSNTIAKQELPLWSAIGLSADPGISLDICVTLSAATASQGYVGLKVRYAE